MKPIKEERQFWYHWLVRYSLGELVGIGTAATLARLLLLEFEHTHFASSSFTAVALLFVGTVEGVIIGYLQWRSLSRFLPELKPGLWVVVTAVSSAVGWLLVLPPSLVIFSMFSALSLVPAYKAAFYTFVAGVAFGGLTGVPQFYIVRKFFTHAMMWGFATATGWGLSFVVIYGGLSLFPGSFLQLPVIVLSCVAAGLLQGVVMVTSLHYLMERRGDSPG